LAARRLSEAFGGGSPSLCSPGHATPARRAPRVARRAKGKKMSTLDLITRAEFIFKKCEAQQSLRRGHARHRAR